jgi:hypothetical protein
MLTAIHIVIVCAIAFCVLMALAVVAACRVGSNYDRETERLFEALQRDASTPVSAVAVWLLVAGIVGCMALVG